MWSERISTTQQSRRFDKLKLAALIPLTPLESLLCRPNLSCALCDLDTEYQGDGQRGQAEEHRDQRQQDRHAARALRVTWDKLIINSIFISDISFSDIIIIFSDIENDAKSASICENKLFLVHRIEKHTREAKSHNLYDGFEEASIL